MGETPRDWRDERIAELEAENAQLRQMLREALQRIAELERMLGLNSQNSSRPPSTDNEKARKKRRRKKPSGRAPGGQPGHQGHCRELLPEDQVDHIQQHIPPSCRECGQELSAQDATGRPTRHQVFEVVPKLVECTEHQLISCRCPACGETTRSVLPAEVARSGWGPRLVGLSGALSVVCRDSRRQVDWFISEVIGAPSSLGTVQKHLEEVSAALEPGFEQVRNALQCAKSVVGLDETGWRLGNLPYWIWVAETENLAFYLVREGRRKEFAQEIVGELEGRIFVTDRYNGYGFLPQKRRQICHAHLLREFSAMGAREGPMGEIGVKLHASSEAFQKAWIDVKSGEKSRGEFVAWMKKEVVPRWLQLLKEAKSLDEKPPGFVGWLLKDARHVMLWTFLDHEGVEPTNNSAERALRGPVIQRKLSWGSKSEAGLRLMERLWTTAETCRRQGRSLLDYITASMKALRGERAAPVLALP